MFILYIEPGETSVRLCVCMKDLSLAQTYSASSMAGGQKFSGFPPLPKRAASTTFGSVFFRMRPDVEVVLADGWKSNTTCRSIHGLYNYDYALAITLQLPLGVKNLCSYRQSQVVHNGCRDRILTVHRVLKILTESLQIAC